MADVIDDDTEQAILKLWQRDAANLSSVVKQPPQTGRLKSPTAKPLPSPYAQIESKFESHELFAGPAGGGRKDRRRVTITIRGLRADVVKAAALVFAIFNKNLGLGDPKVNPAAFTLEYPSGARFISWWPITPGEITEDKDTKAGQDVWVATIIGRVTSVRST